MPEEDNMPAGQDPRDAWWAAREAAYRQRPDIRQEIESLRAEARERAREDDARAALLEQRIQDGVPGATQALDEELTRQATEIDPPEPSAKDDPEEWRAFFLEMHGRDMPLNAEYQAELHRIEAAAPPDAGGLAAAYSEANYPRGFDEIELAAEREGKTAEEVRAERGAALDSPPADATHDNDTELNTGLVGALGALVEHAPASRDASAVPAGQPADSFADIWDAFARLRDALGLPGTPGGAEAAEEPAERASSGPVSAALLEDAMAGARASAAWYRDSPEWQRITLVTDAARALLDAIRGEAGGYWSEISQDIRVRGFVRTVAARTCRTISACAGALAEKLEQASGRQTPAWRAMSVLHRTAGAAANRVIGYRPPVADAEQIIAGLSRPRQAAAGPPAAGSPAALAALSFPVPVSQVTTTAPAPPRQEAATRTGRRPGGPRH